MKFSLFQFLRALIVAGWYACRKQGGCIGKAKGIVVALFSKEKQVAKDIQDKRAAACRQCLLFYQPLQTCGSASHDNDKHNKDLEQMGCHCYLPVKIKTPCNCWLYDEMHGENEQGWRGDLNSFPR